jgi:hypothetical protein
VRTALARRATTVINNISTDHTTQYGWTIGQRVVVARAICEYGGEHGVVIGFELNRFDRPLVIVDIDSVEFVGYEGSCFYPFELDEEA